MIHIFSLTSHYIQTRKSEAPTNGAYCDLTGQFKLCNIRHIIEMETVHNIVNNNDSMYSFKHESTYKRFFFCKTAKIKILRIFFFIAKVSMAFSLGNASLNLRKIALSHQKD